MISLNTMPDTMIGLQSLMEMNSSRFLMNQLKTSCKDSQPEGLQESVLIGGFTAQVNKSLPTSEIRVVNSDGDYPMTIQLIDTSNVLSDPKVSPCGELRTSQMLRELGESLIVGPRQYWEHLLDSAIWRLFDTILRDPMRNGLGK